MTRRGRVLAAAASEGLIEATDAGKLRAAWNFASRTRSALTLGTSKTADLLQTDRAQLEGRARIMGCPPGAASRLEDDYLRTTRLARQVFERHFYGAKSGPASTA